MMKSKLSVEHDLNNQELRIHDGGLTLTCKMDDMSSLNRMSMILENMATVWETKIDEIEDVKKKEFYSFTAQCYRDVADIAMEYWSKQYEIENLEK